MKLRAIVTCVAVLTLCMGTASAQTIGVFFDTAGSDCADDFPGGQSFTFYILGILGGETETGAQGGEFKLEGHGYTGGGWFGSCEGSSPLIIGTVEGEGAAIAFTECNAASPVLYYTCTGFNSNAPQPISTLRIVGHDNPSNVNFPCPHQNECSEGRQICSATSGANIGLGAECPVGVEEATWSSVKALFSH